jgi:predicted DNA-binding transcriptional regulator YafY
LSYEIIEGSVSNQTRGTNVEAFDSSPIELLVSKSARNFIEDNRAIIGHVEEGERLLVELNPIDREWLVRTILGFGGQIEVSKPKELALEVVSRAREIKESYRR